MPRSAVGLVGEHQRQRGVGSVLFRNASRLPNRGTHQGMTEPELGPLDLERPCGDCGSERVDRRVGAVDDGGCLDHHSEVALVIDRGHEQQRAVRWRELADAKGERLFQPGRERQVGRQQGSYGGLPESQTPW
jgi:hypothetical protein